MAYGRHLVDQLVGTNRTVLTNELVDELRGVAIANNTEIDNVAFAPVNAVLSGEEYLIIDENVYLVASGATGEVNSTGTDVNGVRTVSTVSNGNFIAKKINDKRTIDSVDLLKLSKINGYDGQALHVGGYSLVSASGFNLVRVTSEDDENYAGTDWNDNGLVNDKLLAFDSDGHAFQLKGLSLKLSWLGAQDDSDVGQAFFMATTYLKSLALNSLLDIDVTGCTSTVQPPVLNSGYDHCVALTSSRSVNNKYHITFTTGDTPIKYSGGSGSLSGKAMDNVYIKSTDSQALEVKGTCGLIFDGCKFRSDVKNPLDLSNDIGAGTFTEFVEFKSCRFQGVGFTRFIRGAGNDSFHGVNFDDGCVVNLLTASEWIFQFGDGANAEVGRIIWYNGECSATFFYSGTNELELISDGTLTTYSNFVTLSGQIRTEFGANWVATLSDYIAITLTQAPMELTVHFSFYKCWISNRVAYKNNGAVVRLESWTERRLQKESTDNFDSFYLGLGNPYFPMEVDIEFFATNYQVGYTLALAGRPSASISPTLAVVRTWRSFNTAGYGSVTFTLDTSNDDVYVTPDNSWASAEVRVKMTLRNVRTQSDFIQVAGEDASVTEYTA